MNLELDISGDQIDGARDYQEDAFMVSQLGDVAEGTPAALIIMADGMGGHAAGNIASNMVIATFNKAFQAQFPPADSATSNLLKESLNIANAQITASVQETPALAGMGCTMVTGYIVGNKLWWISVGDSHLYLVRDKEIIKQNADHSYGAFLDLMAEQGQDMDDNPSMSRNMLMSALTGSDIASIDCPEEPLELKPSDRIIIASDGLDTLDLESIAQFANSTKTTKECVDILLKAVINAKRPRQDNTTIIAIDLLEKAAKKEPKPIVLIKESNDFMDHDNEKKPSSKKSAGLFSSVLKSILLFILCGGIYFAWELGFIDNTIKAVTSQPKEIQIAQQNSTQQKTTPKAPETKTVAVKNQSTVQTKPFKDRLNIGGHAPQMLAIPSGSYRMGGATSVVSIDETPRHYVTLKSFAMSTYEVTFADYELFARSTNKTLPKHSGLDKSRFPVTHVSWDDAVAYTQWLSQQTNQTYRLPSESEWEYAARGNTRTSFWWGSAKGDNNAQCFDCKSGQQIHKTASIGSFKPNPFGLHDTLGNVFEWTQDCYHKNYQGAPTDGSAWEEDNCTNRVARGGAFASPASSMRVENREKFNASQGRDHIGIRLVREL